MNRLVILTYDYCPNNGGIARLCGEIRNQCIKTNRPYLVITPVFGPDEPNVVRITARRGVVEWKIWRYLMNNITDEDVILTGTFHPDGLLAVLSGAKNRCFLAHGAELLPGQSWFRRKLFSRYRRWLLSKATKVIANSRYTSNLVKICSPKANVIPLPLAVDNVRFRPTLPKYDDGKLHLCSISRLEKFKGHDFIIKTICGLPKEYRNRIMLEIGGKGAYKHVLEQMVADFGLKDQVKFLGFIDDDELCDFYSRNDVFILCTREEKDNRNVEGFGLVFTEAQACGTPCIGANAGGIPDAIDNGNGGWLIEQDNEQELQSLLIKLIENPDIIYQQSINALNRINTNFTWNKYFKHLKNEIDL